LSGTPDSGGRLPKPPRQTNLARATRMAFEALGGQSEEQMLWLGAEPRGLVWRLPVLDDAFEVDVPAGRVRTSAGQAVGPPWTILALHYLATDSQPEDRPPEATFAELPTARSYATVYHGRVIGRLCATAGRDAQRFRAAAAALGGHPAESGDAAFDFQAFPRLTLRLIWHAPDEEFPPSATLLLPGNVESYFCPEDIVVLSELLVARLGARPF